MMKKLVKKPDSIFVPLVGDGAVASFGVGDGRMIPVLIVDCTNKAELLDIIHAHSESHTGDVVTSWGWPRWRSDRVYLIIKFTKPSELEVGIIFNLKEHSAVVQGILQVNAIYLQPSESGMNVADGLMEPKIIVEIPDTDFLPRWNKIYRKHLIKDYKKDGLSNRQAKEASSLHMERMRKYWNRRLPA